MSGFRAEIAAEPLEMRAEQHDIAAQVLVDQEWIRWHRRQRSGALEVNLMKAGQSIILPDQQGGGWHGRFPPQTYSAPIFSAELNRNIRRNEKVRQWSLAPVR